MRNPYEDESNDIACVETAKRNGHTIEEAEWCDNGSVGCPDCPFKLPTVR